MDSMKEKVLDFIYDMTWYEIGFVGIVFLIIFLSIYLHIDKKFKEKYGYSILFYEYLFISSGISLFLRLGTFWRSYAIQHGRPTLYSSLLLGFGLFCLAFMVLGGFIMSYKKSRKLMWLNALLGLGGCILVYWMIPFLLGVLVLVIVCGILGGGNSNSSKAKYWQYQAEDAHQRSVAKEMPTINIKRDDELF